MLAVMDDISPTVVDAMIRVWKIARLSADTGSLAFPSNSVLGKVVEIGPDAVAGARGAKRGAEPPADGLTDAERVQSIVENMPPEMRSAFEAYHLGIIREESCWGTPHKVRALILGISHSTYKVRVSAGWRFLQDWIPIALDPSAQKG